MASWVWLRFEVGFEVEFAGTRHLPCARILRNTYGEKGNTESRTSRLWTITGAAQDRKARIFGEAWIGFGKAAKQEQRALCGFNRPRVLAVVAQTESLRVYVTYFAVRHRNKRSLLAKRFDMKTAAAIGSVLGHRRARADSAFQSVLRRCEDSPQYSSP